MHKLMERVPDRSNIGGRGINGHRPYLTIHYIANLFVRPIGRKWEELGKVIENATYL